MDEKKTKEGEKKSETKEKKTFIVGRGWKRV